MEASGRRRHRRVVADGQALSYTRFVSRQPNVPGVLADSARRKALRKASIETTRSRLGWT